MFTHFFLTRRLIALTLFLSTAPCAWSADRVVVIPLNSTSPEVKVVTSGTGRNWMDRNLGADRVAMASNDPAALGFLYQWGRASDGHQYPNSRTTSTLAGNPGPGHWDFIRASVSPYDWLSTKDDTLWQGVSGLNNPCPQGFKVPTAAEWQVEMDTWSPLNADGAFASPLKLAISGYRDNVNGNVIGGQVEGCYWTSTVSGDAVKVLRLNANNALFAFLYRARACSVRCIKN